MNYKPCTRSQEQRDAVVFWSNSSFGYDAIAEKVGLDPKDLRAWLAEDEELREQTRGANVDENRLYTQALAAACKSLQGTIIVEETYDCRESDSVPIKVVKRYVPPDNKMIMELLRVLNPAKFAEGAVSGTATGKLLIDMLSDSEFKQIDNG